MYIVINDVENKIHGKSVERDGAFKILNELTVKGIEGHVMNCVSEQEAVEYCVERAKAV